MKIAVAGTGYVGLVTGVALAEIGHDVTCVDIDEKKLEVMRSGVSPIYEEGLEELMNKNKDRLIYTSNYKDAYKDADVIIIGVGTPERKDGSANLDYVFGVAEQIADSLEKDCVVVVKSTVPIGTNDEVEKYINDNVKKGIRVHVASNPEFLAQGTAVRDTLHASRIVIGTEDKSAEEVLKKMYEPLTKEPYNVPLLATDRRSAEMIKYASNDFLALKISYINEIANLCDALGANVEDVSRGMGLDSRIGNKFLNAGIGYGGSCFPKDTKALHYLSVQMGVEAKTIKACIEVNEKQKNSIQRFYVNDLGLKYKPELEYHYSMDCFKNKYREDRYRFSLSKYKGDNEEEKQKSIVLYPSSYSKLHYIKENGEIFPYFGYYADIYDYYVVVKNNEEKSN